MYVLDFGQSRGFLDKHGAPLPPRPTADFRGTSLYSSLNAHRLKELGRRDDLWSVFYCCVDLARGGLPWRPAKEDRPTCDALKTHYSAHPAELVAGLPGEGYLLQFQEHLLGLAYEARPSYALLAALLRAALAEAADAGALASRSWGWYELTPGVRDALAPLIGASGEASPAAAASAAAAAAALAMYSLPREAQLASIAASLGAAPSRELAPREDEELLSAYDAGRLALSCDAALDSRARLMILPAPSRRSFPLPTALVTRAVRLQAQALRARLSGGAFAGAGEGQAQAAEPPVHVEPASEPGTWLKVDLPKLGLLPSHRALLVEDSAKSGTAEAAAIMAELNDKLEVRGCAAWGGGRACVRCTGALCVPHTRACARTHAHTPTLRAHTHSPRTHPPSCPPPLRRRPPSLTRPSAPATCSSRTSWTP